MLQALFIFCAMFGYRSPLSSTAGGKVDPRCYTQDYVRAWVYFTDKGVTTENYNKALVVVRAKMDRTAFQRRTLRKGVIDYADIPLSRDYIGETEANNGLLIKESKWLNAASFWIAKQDLDKIAGLNFVYKITRVANFQGPRDTEIALQDTAVYGITYQQLKMFNIDKLHEKGVFGSNIKIGMLDTGLRKKHSALNNIKVVAEHDFLGGDQIFLENTPITESGGVYSDMVFHKTSSRLNLFVTGDDTIYYLPVRDILYTYSSPDGSNWSPLVNITNNGAGNWVRELAICGRDTMFIFYQDRYGLKYLVRRDTVLISSGSLGSTLYRQPSGVQIDDTVYAAFHGYQNKHYLYLKKGTASGFPIQMTIDSSSADIKYPEVISGTGKIGIFYYTLPQDSIFFLKSSLPVNANTFTKIFFAQGKDVQSIAFGDTMLLIWKDTSNEPLFRIAFAKSVDFGPPFSTPIYLSENLNSINKISIERFDNTVTATWESEGRIYFATSYDNGENFNTTEALSKEFVYLPTLGTTNAEIKKIYCQRGDSITDGYDASDAGYLYPRHGTEMLGLIGGYLSGQYIGVAPGAQFLVAKTENPDDAYEFPVEEDTWVCGLEWLESHGTDIASSSLGYTLWYDWPDDYDGKTSPASIAAYEATRRGMIVVNAVGNVKGSIIPPHLVAPGDAEGVITVGGIDTLYNRWQGSLYGSTADGRLKPEIMCLSAAPIVVNPDTSDLYLYSFGTSGATAMVSGICALLLEGHPNWSVDSVRNALFNTASFADSPTDSMGYGWADALAAFNYSPPAIDTVSGNVWLTPYPNPYITSQHDNIFLPFKLNQSASAEIRIFSVTGRLIKKQERTELLLPGRYISQDPQSPNAAFIWDGKDEKNREVGSGIYYCVLITHGAGNDLIKIAVIR